MSSPFVGQIIMFGGNFAPAGWALCDGSLLPIEEYMELFNLIGTTYGGDGQTTFAVPDLRGRVPISNGQGRGLSNYALGNAVGMEEVRLTQSQLPPHQHPVAAVNQPGNANVPAGNVLLAPLGGQAGSGDFQVSAYAPAGNQTDLNANSVTPAGGSQPHSNIQPYLAVNYCIALEGVYPSPG
jgi:microcystin-dependent protein